MVLMITAYHFFMQGVDVFYSDAPLPWVHCKRRADESPSVERSLKCTASGTTYAGTPGRVVEGPKGFGKVSTQDDPGRAESSLGIEGAGAQADSEPTSAAAGEQADASGDAAPGTQAAADGVKAGDASAQPGAAGEQANVYGVAAPGAQAGAEGAKAGGDAGAGTNAGGRLSSSWRRSLPRTFSPLGVEGGPGRHAGKEATGDDEEEVEDILRRQGVLPWTNYISPLQASWFQVGQQEREALKKGFDDAADKADAEAMYEAGIMLMQKMQKIAERFEAKSEPLEHVFSNVTEIEGIRREGLPKRRRPVAKTSVAKLTAKLEEALKESNDLRTQLAGNFRLSFALTGFVLALWIDVSFPVVAQATIESDAAEEEQLAKDLKDKTTAFDNLLRLMCERRTVECNLSTLNGKCGWPRLGVRSWLNRWLPPFGCCFPPGKKTRIPSNWRLS
uniref:Uncharacterized protein n=1 Tax=Oryza rufipogon TaxID=4529 RepID=A0A0E0RJ99_ORYRU